MLEDTLPRRILMLLTEMETNVHQKSSMQSDDKNLI